ncbi:LysR family transcriptional regulator [Roseicyclus mahoneyensis]|nr:LysR family transcriptional regulator [Roseicyclus mahoneyensis]
MVESLGMETLSNLEAFVRSAEAGSFSAAARRLALTPAAVSRSVAMLERNLGVRLFHRSTRKLRLTEAGENFLASIGGPLDQLQGAIATVGADGPAPAGTLKLSMPPSFGAAHVLPLLPGFLARYPLIRAEWHFENRVVDLVAEGYDAAIGGAIERAPGTVARTLAPLHIIAVASPAYMTGRRSPTNPAELADLDGIAMRVLRTGRIRHFTLRDAAGREMVPALNETIVLSEPIAIREAAKLGLGVALLAVAEVLSDLEEGRLIRLLPDWYADDGGISVYYASRSFLPAKTRAFIDWIDAAFKGSKLPERFNGQPPRHSSGPIQR